MFDSNIPLEKKEYKNIEYFIKKEMRFYAFYYILSNRIIITSGLHSILNENELFAVLAHEECHKKDRLLYLGIIFSGFITLISMLISIILYIFNNSYLQFLIIILVCCFIIFLLQRVYIYLEFKADEYSSKKIDNKYIISSLNKQRKYEKLDEYLRYKIIEKLIAPNYKERIRRLKK